MGVTAARPMALPQGTYGRLRAPEQVRDGAGVDMTTIPRRSSGTCAFAGTNGPTRPSQRTNRSLAEDLDRAAVGIGTLWEIGDGLFASINALERENLDAFTPDGLVACRCSGTATRAIEAMTKQMLQTRLSVPPKLLTIFEGLSSFRFG